MSSSLFTTSILVIALAVTLAHARSSHSSGFGPPLRHNYTFETVTGFFLQDFNSTNSSTFDVLGSNFGLVSTAPLHWEAFKWSISELNKGAPKNVSYRVLYLARHGEGWHNRAETIYGTPAWNAYWSLLDGDGTITWGPDAELTPVGVAQAQNVSAAWKVQAKAGIPLPQTLYTSPLTRAADTLNITWADILIDKKDFPKPVIIEWLRETIGVHTCDMRRTKTFIHDREPSWIFEKGFTENDELWTPTNRETSDEQQARSREALVEILNNDDSTYISITSHSGTTGGLLAALGHRAFDLGTGDLIPVVIKSTQIPATSST